jgi:hypothetical protein
LFVTHSLARKVGSGAACPAELHEVYAASGIFQNTTRGSLAARKQGFATNERAFGQADAYSDGAIVIEEGRE